MDMQGFDWQGFIEIHQSEIRDLRKPKTRKEYKEMTSRKYTDSELAELAGRDFDSLDGNQKKAVKAWRKRQAKEDAAADVPTMAERADKAVEAVMQATEADNAAIVTISHASDTKPEEEDTAAMNRRIIADRLGRLHDAALGVLSASFDAGDKVAHAYACKILSGELMDLKANYCQEES